MAAARAGFRRLFSNSAFSPLPSAAVPHPAEPYTNLFVSGQRLFSISAFSPPPSAAVPPPADPSTNLFVSGLSKRTTTDGLREAFEKFGQVLQARVVTDRVSGYSKGFGFVRYATLEDAAEGIKGMDGKFLDGWVIFAEYARPRPPPPQASDSPSSY